MTTNAQSRWNAFLKQIADRHAAVCSEARQAALDALRSNDYDPSPIAVAWGAVTHRLGELERRISETWHEKVEAAFESEGRDRATLAAARKQGEDLAFELENARERVEKSVYAQGAREMYARAISRQNGHICPNCGAPVEVPFTAKALNFRCTHCDAIVSFEPGSEVRMAVAFGAHALAWEAAYDQWVAMRIADRAAREARSPTPIHLLKAYERAQIAHWFKYLEAKALWEPELRDIPHEVRSRMEQWYRMFADYQPEWVKAGRPQEPISDTPRP